MAMASDIIQIGRTSCQSKQQRPPSSPPGEELLGLYGSDSSADNAVLGLLLSKKLEQWLHIV